VKRRDFITLLGGAAAAWPLAVRAQQRIATKRIGWLTSSAETDELQLSVARIFAEEMSKLGWTDGSNLRIDHRWGITTDDSRIRVAAAELVNSAPDLILATGAQQTLIYKQLTRAIPILFTNVGDPAATGIIATFSHPEANITGFTSVEFSFAGKWVGILKDIAPDIARVRVLYYPDNPASLGYLKTVETVAAELKVGVARSSVTSVQEIERAMESIAGEPKVGLIVIPSALINQNREKLPHSQSSTGCQRFIHIATSPKAAVSYPWLGLS
jgi:putative ABC transport system substrate-binding protein